MPRSWSGEESRKLMSIVLEVRGPGNPTALDWNKVVSVFNAQATTPCDVKQAVNHYHACRYKWVAWTAMVGNTGFTLQNGLPSAADISLPRMEQFIEKYKAGGAGKYVTKHRLLDLDLWNPIFGGMT